MQSKLRRIGGSFSHAHSSTLWKKSKRLEYTSEALLSIAIDHFSKADYAWLHESKSIIPEQYIFAKNNYKLLKCNYSKVFTHDQELIAIDPSLFVFAPACGYWIDDPKIYTKSKLLSFITSNKTICPMHRYRLSWAEKLKGKCDLFGRGIREIEKKEQGLNEYMFSIAIENGKYDTYFTEKILDCFATGTVPIYFGTDRIIEHFNKDGIIFLDDSFDPSKLSENLYYSKKEAIEDNFNRVLNYYTVEDWIVANHGELK